MAEDNDDIEHEELDVTPGKDDTPAGDGKGDRSERGTAEDTSSDRSDRVQRPTANRWRGVQAGIGETLKGIKGDESDHEPPEEEDEDLEPGEDDLDDDEDLEGREDRSDRKGAGEADDDEDPERKGEKGKGGADDDSDLEDTGTRYEVVDAAGDVFQIELPEGAVIRLRADGQDVELKSVDELVANAQKGLAFDRVTSMAGQENAALRQIVGEFETAQKADSDLLLKLLFDELEEEEIETLREELKAYRDPKAREGLQALADKQVRDQQEEAEGKRAQEAKTKEFWAATEKQAKTDLSRFEFLDAEDLPEIQTRFHGLYLAERERLIPSYKQQAAAQKLSEEDAILAADRDARKVLHEKNLRQVMRQLNAKYEKRAGKGGPPKGEKGAKREAEQHNRRVDRKLDQRRDPRHRSLRGGGSAPRDRTDGNRGREKQPQTFDQKIQRGLARLRQAGRPQAGSGAEEE